jgi:hypothetical protein
VVKINVAGIGVSVKQQANVVGAVVTVANGIATKACNTIGTIGKSECDTSAICGPMDNPSR